MKFAIVTEWDCTPQQAKRFRATMTPDGPLLHEGYLERLDFDSARQRKAVLRQSYGWCRLYLLLSQTQAALLAAGFLALGVIIGLGGAAWLAA